MPHLWIGERGGALTRHELTDLCRRLAFVRRELGLTIAGLLVTLTAALFTVSDILGVLAIRTEMHAWAAVLTQGLFCVIVVALIYGACVYHLGRVGQLRRHAAHVPAAEEDLRQVYREEAPPLLTVLVPSYMEEARVVRRTLLSAALQEYPCRRIVLLIDDPPFPGNDHDAERLGAARALPREIEQLLDEPKKLCAGAVVAFFGRRAMGPRHAATERLALVQLYTDIAAWFERQADLYEIVDHADQLFVKATLRGPARDCRAHSERFQGSAADVTDESNLAAEYARLSARFRTNLTAFERKRYDNLSQAPNKAMNLNSYIALLGRSFREVDRGDKLLLEPTELLPADITVPPSEFILVVDADSLLTPDYALRLMHVLRTPGNERVAVAQTPYNAFPGPLSPVERIAGATTDIQYLMHQGFTHYGATYWVGANAIVRVAALADIAARVSERGYEITRFIRDDTVIEDTESTVDLIARGWRLYNYPGRLAYSETPPDFGALLIQRRRWANGGLIIFPKLVRHFLRERADRGRFLQAVMMAHYLVSLTAVNIGLLVILAFSFDDGMRTAWLPFTAIPYYALYARDLQLVGYRGIDILRVYALNLVLIPVNLVGVLSSLQQILTGRKAAFGRTPKVQGRTPVPGIYLLAHYAILALWVVAVLRDFVEDRPLHALLTITNIGFLVYGIVVFVGSTPAQVGGSRDWATGGGTLLPQQGKSWHSGGHRPAAA